ncbi:MAG: cobalamin-dependent protein [Acidimicrobiia bacterium]|nr:cobalamin-dependent protein [Acidimicrobiia bacterium]
MISSTLSLQEAAQHLGVHYMTAYRYVRLGLLPASKVKGSWQVRVEDLEGFRSPTSTSAEGGAPWAARLEARMLAGDVAGAWSVVEAALASGADPADIYVEVLAPALDSVGEGWAQGRLEIEDEHIASSVALRIIGRLGPRFARRGRPRGKIVTATPQGERHGLGVAMLADILRGEGFEVLDLGPDTPTGSLVAALERMETPDAVCISVATDESHEAARHMIEAAKASAPGCLVVLGGRGIADEPTAASLGADRWARDPRTLIELISR